MKLSIPNGDLETYLGFIDESRDHLDSIEQKVLGLRANTDLETVNALFRALHTIKGIAGFLALGDIQKLSHSLESVFDAIRQSKITVDEQLIRIALENIDHLVTMMHRLEAGLNARSLQAGGQWSVSVEAIDFQAGYEELGTLLENSYKDKTDQDCDAKLDAEALITPEMQGAFIKEAEELIDATEQVFLRLGDCPDDGEGIAQAFRNIHSFKGNCGFFGYADLEKAGHALESVLEGFRQAGGPISRPVVEISLKCLDAFRSAIASLSSGQGAALPNIQALLSRFNGLMTVSKLPLLGEVMIQEGLASPEAVAKALAIQNQSVNAEGPAASPGSKSVAKRDLRVDLAKLDQLMDLVGELVISTGMILNHNALRSSDAPDLEKITHHLKGVVSDLQSVALGVRMVPIEGTFRKMTRLVHDLSSKIGKSVKLEFLGEETEVDKTVIDLIADPLVHMIRNSIDHGLESPSDRKAAGKDAHGVVTLEAGQEGGEILITIRDDGRGMNREKILAKALERGLVENDGAELSDDDVFQFIFKAGFSTAEAVTSTSGRGVGMDVVKSNIDKLGGRIHIASKAGSGSSITLRIPLTLSIIEGMMVKAGESLFILPLTAVKESLAPRPEQLFSLTGGQDMLMLRGMSLPIYRLGKLYGLSDCSGKLTEGLLIHLQSRDARFCLAVDDLLGQRQVVVKALPAFMGNVPGTNSCSILDNGEIALILDVADLIQKKAA